ncbi:OpgC family protein [Bosea sp. (in: a-proteobacteria)]|uniref:OpgC family protein n=1 Tax=Bosea sp. (in: a-proteobacteria) TaxID=1871050 RepID=UPI002733FE12|nr:OpgC domain-containing protein [Bosea sp. (in: a-proteobacteria)]MDP3258079.1 OpgC domain-containing protein [Bosea sp. (in: a-proteobacteria)]
MAEPARPPKRPRDERLDLFRGLTMLIIFVAHVPANSWNAWIPARFGFSSGAELFVFCSGFASALAFGATFVRRGWWLGTARILQRLWQVYWAHIGLVVALVALAALLDRVTGGGELARQFAPLMTDPERALLGLVTLTWQPDYLDILPMYLVILALIPLAIALRRLHPWLPFLMVALLYALVWTEGLNLPGNPWNGAGWFLNPFAWQAIFFIGFFIAMKWLPVPPLRRPALLLAAAVFMVVSVPFSFWGILEHWPAGRELRELLLPAASEKSNLHPLRILHFLALAYLVLSAIEPVRHRLDAGFGHLLILIGRQSLAAFLASIVLSRLAWTASEMAGHDGLAVALLNLAGFAAILGVARLVGWFKRAPWAGPPPPSRDMPAERTATAASRLREAS